MNVIRELKDYSSEKYLEVEIPGVYLRPVKTDITDAEQIAEWRAKAVQSFFTWIKPSGVDMLKWLRDYEKDDYDIIFFVEIKEKILVGQMSLYDIDFNSGKAQFGRVIRGNFQTPKGIMTIAARAILHWGYCELGLKEIYLRVFADNDKAILFYNRLGFWITDTLFYHMICRENRIIQWVKSDIEKIPTTDDRYRKIYEMTLKKKTFLDMQKVIKRRR
jgi:RimJ/RimL family protein N-acetyltransferase